MTEDLNSKIFNLILGRVLKRSFLDFDEKIKQSVKELTSPQKTPSTSLRASKKYMPDLKKLFEEEAQKIEEEIKEEIEKQITGFTRL